VTRDLFERGADALTRAVLLEEAQDVALAARERDRGGAHDQTRKVAAIRVTKNK
jgi:hypothetical protein